MNSPLTTQCGQNTICSAILSLSRLRPAGLGGLAGAGAALLGGEVLGTSFSAFFAEFGEVGPYFLDCRSHGPTLALSLGAMQDCY